MTKYKRILVPVDGSETSRNALRSAFKLASNFDSRVRVLYVVEGAERFSGSPELMRRVHEAGEQILDDALALAEIECLEADKKLVEHPEQRLGESIAQEARAWEADLIVVGTHGRKGVGRALLGSGAEQIIRLAPVPVLVVRG